MPGTPSFAEALSEVIEARLLDLHTALPGRIKSYDPATQTAEVIPAVKRAIIGDAGKVIEDLPIIPNVPIAWPRGGCCYIHFPLREGDHVLLVFSEAATGLWRETGQTSEPGDLARHDLSYPVAIPGVAPNAGAFEDAPTDQAVLIIESKLRVSTANGEGVEPVALAEKVLNELNAIRQYINQHTHGTGVGPSGPPITPMDEPQSVASATLEAE